MNAAKHRPHSGSPWRNSPPHSLHSPVTSPNTRTGLCGPRNSPADFPIRAREEHPSSQHTSQPAEQPRLETPVKTLADLLDALAWVVYGAAFLAVLWLFDHLPQGLAPVVSMAVGAAGWLVGRGLQRLANLLISITRL